MAAGKYGIVIADESHNLRTCDGENGQTAAVRQLISHADKAVLLSGTPSICRTFDLAGQLHALQPQRLGLNFDSFKVAFGFRCAPCLASLQSTSWKQLAVFRCRRHHGSTAARLRPSDECTAWLSQLSL
jgi:hypothetical protein